MLIQTLLSSPLHRQPVKWSLYRPLLQLSSKLPLPPQHCNELQQHIREEFKRSRNVNSVERVKRKVVEGEQFLLRLERASSSDYQLNQLHALASHLLIRRSLSSPPSSSSSPPPPPSKPRLRPSILHSTQFAPAMPRLRPQPIGTSMMIFKRRRALQKRFDRVGEAKELAAMGRAEERSEEALLGNEGRKKGEGWGWEWEGWLREAKGKEVKEYRRNESPIPTAMQERANEANKEREKGRLARSRRVLSDTAHSTGGSAIASLPQGVHRSSQRTSYPLDALRSSPHPLPPSSPPSSASPLSLLDGRS